jgi:hypothetical protein
MRLSFKTKQVLGVTSIVALAVVVLSAFYIVLLARDRLQVNETYSAVLAKAIYQRAFPVVRNGEDPTDALRGDEGLHSMLESSLYVKELTYAAIVDTENRAIAHSDSSLVGQVIPEYEDAGSLLQRGPIAAARAVRAGRKNSRDSDAAAAERKRIRRNSRRRVDVAHPGRSRQRPVPGVARCSGGSCGRERDCAVAGAALAPTDPRDPQWDQSPRPR